MHSLLTAASHPHDPLAWLDEISGFHPTGLVGNSEELISSDSSQSAPSGQSPFSGSLTPLNPANSTSESPEHLASNDDGYASETSTSDSSSSSRQAKKARIALDPSQPLTAKGKPRARVYVACHECRTRKIRCDGAKPVCFNCQRRDASLEHCTYDAAPKRRGQDKIPGSRTRTGPGKPDPRHIQPSDHDGECRSGSPRSRARSRASAKPHFENLLQGFDPAAFDPEDVESYRLPTPPPMAMHANEDEDEAETSNQGQQIAATPSMKFARETWWDALLVTYTNDSEGCVVVDGTLSNEQRLDATQRIFTDIRTLLRASLYWASFMHLPRFFETILDPVRRQTVQPALLIGMLAVGALVKRAKDRTDYAKDRKRAMKLVDHAHSAIQASLASNWVDVGLVEAAWFVSYFEMHGHNQHKTERCRSSMLLLDSLIRLLSLTTLDVTHPQGRYAIFYTYQLNGASTTASSPPFMRHDPRANSFPYPAAPCSTNPPDEPGGGAPGHTSGCGCEKYTLKQQWPTVATIAPLWQATAMWPQGKDLVEGEVQKEEGRRLVWSSIMLTSSYESAALDPRNQEDRLNLHLEDYHNLAVLFPGETVRDKGFAPVRRDNVWNLCIRAMLLWYTSMRTRANARLSLQERAEFATNAWLEADAIEAALDAHSCNLEAGTLYQAREYLFNCRMCVSHEFRLFAPQVTTNGFMSIYREKAETWLRTQMWVADWIWKGLRDPDNILAGRPLLLYWFMGHINRALSIFDYDPTLLIALEAAKVFTKPLEYLLRLWPGDYQRRKWETLRIALVQACLRGGVDPPACAFTIPPDPLPQDSGNKERENTTNATVEEVVEVPSTSGL